MFSLIHTVFTVMASYSENNALSVRTKTLRPGRIAQLVTCLTADPGVASLILARSHTFVQIDHKIISTAILLPSADS